MGITKEQITARNVRTACLQFRDGEELEDHRATVSFSSETPVERWGYSEILSHDPECIRQGERQKHMPVLFNHNRDDLCGVVEETWIGDDRRQYATIRFAQTERGQEVESLVRDGILTNVSFMYQIYAWEQPEENVIRAIDWEAFEISLVTIPADAGVGVGRADPGKVAPEPKSDDIAREAQKEERKMTDKSSDDILREERARVAEIDALCRQHGMDDNWRNDMISKGESVDNVRSAILQKIATERSARPASPVADMSQRERREYSLLKVIQDLSAGRQVSGLEKEVSDALRRSQGLSDTGGIYIPSAIGSRAWTGGDSLVGTQLLADQYASYLRERSTLARMGATVLTGLVGDVEIPAGKDGVKVYWGKDTDITASDMTFGTVSLTPQQAGAITTIPRSLLIQSTPSAEQIVRDDLFNALAEAVDMVAINGSGSGQPTGILNDSDVSTIALGTNGGLISWDTIVDMAVSVVDNAKTQRYSPCNATETLLVHEAVLESFLPRIGAVFQEKGVEMRCDAKSLAVLDAAGIAAVEAAQQDWDTEYNAPVISIASVESLDAAIDFISEHGSNHTDAIITNDLTAAERFLREVDSGSVMVNCSTRLADGFEYGLGAEIGISTGKLHARGPVGLEGLTSLKYIVLGHGEGRR